MSDAIAARREAFKRFVQAHGRVAGVARRSGVPATTLYSYLQGSSDSLKGTTEEKIAAAFDVPVSHLFSDAPLRREVVVAYYVGAGSMVHAFAEGQGPFDQVEAPEDATDYTVAARVQGHSMGPWFDNWLVFFDDVREPVTADLVGEICVVGLPDGRVLLKKLQASRTPGLFHLLSQFEPPITDVEVAWAARVTSMRPR